MQKPFTVVAAAALMLASSLCSAQLPYSRSMDPRETFLRTNFDPDAIDAAPIELAALGLQPGDTIRITRYGDFSYSGANTDDAKGILAVFSASSQLGASSLLNRVTDAIDAGADIITLSTLLGGLPTDISQDFRVSPFFTAEESSTIAIEIPQGATHLFLGVHDSYFGDNFDPDGDFSIEISGVRTVSIDIKPGSSENTINTGSNGVLAVAILSSAGFDALSVDPATVTLAGASVRQRGNGSLHYEIQDVNGDGLSDLVVHFQIADLTLAEGDTSASLSGFTTGGLEIKGTDAVRVK